MISNNDELPDVSTITDQLLDQIKDQAASRCFRSSNVLRNHALSVLRGPRTGRIYNLPFTGNKKGSKKTTYQASAPGEPPAVRTGAFRQSWNNRWFIEGSGKNIIYHPAISSVLLVGNYLLAELLENGTSKMEPRPFKEKIIEDSKEEVAAIFGDKYELGI
jgi:HK97 gp10 family phage protein